MAKTAEHKKVVKVKGKITRVNILDGGNAVEILHDTVDCTESKATSCANNQDVAKAELSFEEKFPIVRASQLSLEDAFLKHKPTTDGQRRLRSSLITGIKVGLKDFRCPVMDPSLDEDGNLVYEAGKMPAVGHSPEFWAEKFKEFMPEKNSRVGVERERDALLGLLIKYLTEEKKWEVSKAWKAVCDDSKELGHYYNLEDVKQKKHKFERTGRSKVWIFYDWANTRKIIATNYSSFAFPTYLLGGGNYCGLFESYPLAYVHSTDYPNHNQDESVGWMVFDV